MTPKAQHAHRMALVLAQSAADADCAGDDARCMAMYEHALNFELEALNECLAPRPDKRARPRDGASVEPRGGASGGAPQPAVVAEMLANAERYAMRCGRPRKAAGLAKELAARQAEQNGHDDATA